jgi:FecR-like protein
VIHRNVLSPTIFVLSALLFALTSFCAVPQVWAQAVAGSISAISGTATITRGGATIPAAYGTKVNVGDRLATAAASNLTLTFSDSSQIEVTDSSTLTIDENTLNANGTRARTKLSLLNGLVRSLVRTTPGTPPNYEVHTPNAVAAARGTGYDVDHETGMHDDQFKGCTEFSHVSVFEGTVEVYNPTNPSAPPVEVNQGQKVTVPCGLAPLSAGAAAGSGAGAGAGISTTTAAVVGGGVVVVGGVLGGIAGSGGFSGGNKTVVSPSQ